MTATNTKRLIPKIDPECLKFKTPLVKQLLSGGISVEGFILLVRPGDPYMLIGDTLYALTEVEYYALRAIEPMNLQAERLFKYFLSIRKTLDLSDADSRRVSLIESEIPTCPACTYMKYRKEICAMAARYDVKHAPEDSSNAIPDHAEYPEVESPIVPKAFSLLPHMYDVPREVRKSCMDCVEKHLSQAYVLSLEYLQGYPEYVSLVVGHLGEALDELPSELEPVADTLQYLLARTNYTKQPFVPLFAIQPLLRAARDKDNISVTHHPVEQEDTPIESFELDLGEKELQELKSVDEATSEAAIKACRAADNFILGVEKDEMGWRGYMAIAADTLAHAAPRTANIIRNRRLMFGAAPSSIPAEYRLESIARLLEDQNV